MIAKLNYTGRMRILRESVIFRLHRDLTPTRFDAVFDFDTYNFPHDARIVVEAYRNTAQMRFDFGTVVAPTTPADRALDQLPSDVDPLFRVKVVDAEKNLVLGLATELSPIASDEESEATRRPILPIKSTDLGDVVWRVELTDAHPYLELNRSIAGIQFYAQHDPGFQALVFPQVLREILGHMLLVDEYTDDEGGEWHDWVVFVSGFCNDPYPDPDDDEGVLREWIDTAVGSFASRFDVRQKFSAVVSASHEVSV